MIKLVASDHNFVLSDQDGVLVGHMSFQVKKLFAALRRWNAMGVSDNLSVYIHRWINLLAKLSSW